MTTDVPSDDHRESAALDAWISATSRVVVESLRRFIEVLPDQGQGEDHAEATGHDYADVTGRAYFAMAARLADALDANEDTFTNALVANHCRLLALALDAAADALAADE